MSKATAAKAYHTFRVREEYLNNQIDRKEAKGTYNHQYVPPPEIVDEEGSRRWSFR